MDARKGIARDQGKVLGVRRFFPRINPSSPKGRPLGDPEWGKGQQVWRFHTNVRVLRLLTPRGRNYILFLRECGPPVVPPQGGFFWPEGRGLLNLFGPFLKSGSPFPHSVWRFFPGRGCSLAHTSRFLQPSTGFGGCGDVPL